jgi:hypothetical protein
VAVWIKIKQNWAGGGQAPVAHACNPNTWEVDIGRIKFQT